MSAVRATMLAIFDIDGTICDTQDVEGRCYAQAIAGVTGLTLPSLDWTTYADPTSAGIVRDLLADDPDAARKEQAIAEEFVRLLQAAQPQFPGDFSPLPGAVEFIHRLLHGGDYTVAIATGGFRAEAEFKLRCCGLELDAFPYATSSDRPRRRDIIALAARRAGVGLENAVYFGDAPWDLQASRELGVPFIGIGRRGEQLRVLGASPVFRDYREPASIVAALLNVPSAEGSMPCGRSTVGVTPGRSPA